MRYYSPSTGGFYSEAVHGPRQIAQPQTKAEVKAGKRPVMTSNPACTIPDDAVPVSEERFAELMQAQADGPNAIASPGGRPVSIERKPDLAEHRAARRRTRDRLLAASDWTQLADAVPQGGAGVWRTYRQQLRDLDMDGTDWPDAPGDES